MSAIARHPNRSFFEASCSQAAALDPNFGEFAAAAVDLLHGPSIIETAADEFYRLMPEMYWHLPLVWVYLDDEHDDQFDAVKGAEPYVSCLESVDLMKRRSTLHWDTPTHSFHAATTRLRRTLGLGQGWGRLVLGVMTPERVALRCFTVESDLMAAIQTQEARSGINYRQRTQHSSDAIDAALKKSVFLGNQPKHDAQGRRLVTLPAKVHVLVDGVGRRHPVS